jgi:hypothetical protein
MLAVVPRDVADVVVALALEHVDRDRADVARFLDQLQVGAVQAGEEAVEEDVAVRVGGESLEVLERYGVVPRLHPPARIRGAGRRSSHRARRRECDQRGGDSPSHLMSTLTSA